MTHYADYAYYQSSYMGTLIRSPTVFDQAAARAAEYIDSITFDRIPPMMGHGSLSGRTLEKVMKCCCAVADAIVEYQMYGASAGGEAESSSASMRGVKSETQHNYQIQYLTSADTLSSLLGSGRTLEDYLHSICMRYLGSTGLMYRGVD